MAVQLLNQTIDTLQEGDWIVLPSVAYANPSHIVNAYLSILPPFDRVWRVPLVYLTQTDDFTVAGQTTRYEYSRNYIVGAGCALQLLRNNGSNAFYAYRVRNNIQQQMRLNWRIVNFSI